MALGWSQKRQIMWGTAFGAVVLFFVALLVAPFFRTVPTCTDGAQNGSEAGVDCGGECSRFCAAQMEPIVVRWSRMFEVVPGMYTAVAEVRNRNVAAAARAVPYEFSFYDEDNLFITRKEGVTFIEPNSTSYIMEANINVGNRVPVRTTFRFTEDARFEKPLSSVTALSVEVRDKRYAETPNGTRIQATVKNLSVESIIDPVEFIALLVDGEGNAIAGSKTFLDGLAGDEAKTIYFSWPAVFSTPVSSIEIIPRVTPFASVR